jgi:glycine cleavage system transcriptional repressor
MTSKLVLSAVGKDRPGIVNDLSNIVYQDSLNIEDSRMTVLGGEFALLMLVSGDPAALSSLEDRISEIESELDLRILAKPTTENAPDHGTIPYKVEVSSLDHPGIVRNIASFFSSRNINIVNLQTEKYAAPHTGTPMFALNMTIGIPVDSSISRLRDAFHDKCDEMNLDAELKKL